MTETVERKGGCLCGAVQIAARSVPASVGACHCAMCRTWGGGPLMAIDCGTDVAISGQEKVSVFDSSEWAERGFCAACGTHLFYRLKQTGGYHIPAGLFDSDDGLVFDHQVFVDQAPAYYGFANDTKNLTGPELFALFGATE